MITLGEDEVKIILELLQRVQLQGREVPAYNKVMIALTKEVKDAVQEEG